MLGLDVLEIAKSILSARERTCLNVSPPFPCFRNVTPLSTTINRVKLTTTSALCVSPAVPLVTGVSGNKKIHLSQPLK